MKKRNKPIILVTVLILMVGAVAFVNFPRQLVAGGDGHNHGPAPETGNASVQVPDKNEVASSVASSIQKKDPRAQMMRGRPGAPGSEGPQSSLAVSKPAPYKPTMSDSATSTQWYSEATPKEIPKK